MEPFIIGITGASGALYAHRLLRHLKDLGAEVHLVLTEHGKQVVAYEGQKAIYELADKVYRNDDLFAPIASGSFPTAGMIVVPCSMRSLAAMAHGLGDNLLTRAADVTLKEKRRLVLAPREAPLHEGHLDAMLRLARLGAVIAPPVPPFYARPASLEDMVREIAARLIGWAGIDPGDRMTRWGEHP